MKKSKYKINDEVYIFNCENFSIIKAKIIDVYIRVSYKYNIGSRVVSTTKEELNDYYNIIKEYENYEKTYQFSYYLQANSSYFLAEDKIFASKESIIEAIIANNI